MLWLQNNFYAIVGFVCLASTWGCSTEPSVTQHSVVIVPLGFAEQEYPADNIPNADRIELGRRFFFSKALSRTNEISCASCHKPELFFADATPTSPGVEQRAGTRNVPSLINVGYQRAMLREGSVPTLEMQVLVPIQEHNEFDDNILRVVDRLSADAELQALSNKAYGRNLDSYVLTRAIASFERSIVSTTSRYDVYNIRGTYNSLTTEEHEGRKIFFGNTANCGQCHNGVHLTNFSFQNNGLYAVYPDSGRFRFTENANDIGVFKVPSLRNVSHTAPYMFDGSLASLDDVVRHYNSGGKKHVNQNPLVTPLNLSQQQQQQLIAFLKSL